MKILFKTERMEGNQSIESFVQILEGESVIIGRGAAAAIRFSSENVALAHAVLQISDQGLIIQDLGSVSGTLVNNQRTQMATLKEGDRIKAGSHELTIFRDGETWGVLQVVDSDYSEEDQQHSVNAQVKRFEITRHLPPLLTISLFVISSLAAIYFLYPVTTERASSWSSGQLSAAHRHIENNCAACHSIPFAPVQDKDCLVCHAISDHAPDSKVIFKKVGHHFATGEKRCAECHHDHNGATGIIPEDSRLCISCHAGIESVSPDAKVRNVDSWDLHPEFRIKLAGELENIGKIQLGTAAARDLTPLKLNHAIHLKENIRGAQGKTTLQCADCHTLTEGQRGLKPVSFEKNCRSCHALEFDERFAGEQVPHGDTDKVREFLFSRYSQLMLGPDQNLKLQELSRQKPGPAASPEQYNRATLDLINRQVGAAEDLIYTKTGCQLCHQVEQIPPSGGIAGGYHIQKPAIPQTWLTDASFNHKPHLNVECRHCHKGVSESTRTEDVLLPRIDSCRECHAQGHKEGKIESDCVLCHVYHSASELRRIVSVQ